MDPSSSWPPAAERHGFVAFAPSLPPPERPRWGLALGLFAATFFTTTTLGAHWSLIGRTDITSPIPSWGLLAVLSPRTVQLVWTRSDLLAAGLAFSLPTLFILLCHELGHYLTCRRYGLRATLPYFLPVPFGLGTFGAFIRIRSPIRSKRELFDVGVAGPLAGFAALLPFLVYGIVRSPPTPVELDPTPAGTGLLLVQPGPSLATELVTRAVHGPLPPGVVLDLHPFALAAWVGLIATALNLLPLGQLDGGHLLYAVLGARQRRIALPLWLALAVAAFFYPAWWLWVLIVLLIGIRHPPVVDERSPLGAGRSALALLALVLLALCFMPEPLLIMPLRG